MQTKMRNPIKLVAALLLVMALFSSGLYQGNASAAAITVDLCATTGSITAPAIPAPINVTIRGYVLGDCTAVATASAPGGPVITVNQGDLVTVNLHNNLSEDTGLLFQGQAIVPDLVGTGSGTTKSYSFVADRAGVYLYEAALLSNAQHQVAMGLYGALIVRPTSAPDTVIPGQAYADARTAYNDEAVLVLSEIDTALNNNVNPANFDMRNYKPKYWLINGQMFPNTATISTVVGNRVLLRYVNAGLQPHSMSLLGLNQTVIAIDGSPLANARTYAAETLAPGQTLDAIATIPAATTNGSRFALYEASFLQHNNNTAGFGGMLTFIQAGTGSLIITDTTGPATSGVTLSPNPSNGSSNVALSASVSDAGSGNANVTAAEYFIDAPGANGTGTALSGTFGSLTVSVNAILSTAQLSALTSGNHTLYIHGQDTLGNWGSFNIAILTLDKTGPVTSAVTLSPVSSNGSVNVSLTATGNDSASGNSNIAAAEYSIDGGAASAMTVNSPAPIASLSATIPAATLNALSNGSHTVSVRSRDALGNWGAPVTANLVVDKAGPTTSSVSASPNPNNGTLGINSSTLAVRVTANFADTASNISMGEIFIDTVGANGTGSLFIANDGLFNSLSENGYVDIPLTTVSALSSGSHTLYVHAKDAAGNWGATSTTLLVIDKVGPTTSGLTLTPAATNTTAVAISANASDVASGNSNITAAEYFIDAVGNNGAGIALTVASVAPSTSLSGTLSTATLNGLTAGNHTVYVHAKDAAGNWSATVSATFVIDRTAPTLTGISLSPNSFIQDAVSTVALTVNGAADTGGSGLNGGEYWINPPTSTTPAPGSGTQFAGTSASIPVGSFAVGSYTVSARLKDGAGNWSTISTATLTVVPNAIFSDGFESGNFSAWSSRSTTNTSRLNVTTTAALVGTYGLQAQGNNTNYVQYNFTPATGTYDARFYFRPNGNTSTGKDIFAAATASNFNTILFRVRYRLNGTTPQAQIQVGNTANANWVNLLGGTSNNYLEVVWTSGGVLQLYVNGTLTQTLTAGTGSVASIRLGSVTNTGNATLMYFDAFSSKRLTSPLIGP